MSQTKSDDGVYQLLTELCQNTARKYSIQSNIPRKTLVSKMRSHAYELLLKKSSSDISSEKKGEPIVQLLSYYLISHRNVKNVAEYKRAVDLKKVISVIRRTDFGDNKDIINNVIKLLVGLSDSVKVDYGTELFQNPFSFGLLDEMLPKPPCESFGSSQPYAYFPSYVFELPYSLKYTQLESEKLPTYIVQSFDSTSLVPDNVIRVNSKISEIKTFLSPMSLASLTSSSISPSPYTGAGFWNYPRLTAPRDILIPNSRSEAHGVKVSLASTEEVKKKVCRSKTQSDLIDIWEIATQLDKDVPDDIWEVASKLPPIHERQLISTSPREMALWRRIHADTMLELDIISERQFIRHIMYLIIGIETSSFPFYPQKSCFQIKNGLALEGISKTLINGYVSNLLVVGTYYRRLFEFSFNQSLEDHFHTNGLIYEASREVIRRYLLDFRLVATKIYEECCKPSNQYINCMPTLLQILRHMEPLRYEIENIVCIYKLMGPEPKASIPYGAELMSYLFNEISMVTHKKTANTMYNALFTICKVYFKFIQRFIFEGELDDRYCEFFIRKDPQYVNIRSKRYWDKAFHIAPGLAVPDFLKTLAKFILLCGKSLRLLKHCNPSDPLVLLISSDHPSVKCCSSFEELERQQEVLDVYRTRCLFVSGEPVTFGQILLKREAERKAFTEMASVKQAETLDKIVAERKRLAQLIIAEKQHSLRVLEAAMAEAKASKQKAKQRAKRLTQLQEDAEKAAEEVDSRLRDDERNKIMEYYSKLNMEVEKSKIHTEWKIKRLQLDESRMQLLSTEERNLKREKLELEHKKNEDIMSISIQSFETIKTDELDIKDIEFPFESAEDITKTDEASTTKTSTHMLSAICNAAKSIFGGTKTQEDKPTDNTTKSDSEGNIIPIDKDTNLPIRATKSSSDVIGHDLNDARDNIEFHKVKDQALKNKEKVMAHEFGQTDTENILKDIVVVNMPDEENNIKSYLTPFVEANRNRLKVLGDDFNTAAPVRVDAKPKTEAHRQALANRDKVLGVEYNLPYDAPLKKVRDEFNTAASARVDAKPKSEAHKEALANRDKVLGVEYNLPYDAPVKREPANLAQEEAVRNRDNNMNSENMWPVRMAQKRDPYKKSGLTLKLKPYSDGLSAAGDTGLSHGQVSSDSGMITPLFSQMDLETPTTADVPFEGAMTSNAFTPRDETYDPESATPDKGFPSPEGFDFSIIEEVAEIANDIQPVNTPNSSPSESIDYKSAVSKRSGFNLLNGTYSFEEFDPFGVKALAKYSKNYFNSKMDVPTSGFSYTHPAVIMEEVRKAPYANIFASHFGPDHEDKQKITCDNIATLTACLQRSVMLPLTYQLEVVNNSILTYFLVNLDMYEHMRSLKDYFFLMDGEFSKSICQNIFSRLSNTLNPQELLNFVTLHNILDKALGSSISHVHKFSENLSFTIDDSPLSFQHSSPDVLACLSLTYAVSWPLNIILSQEALIRYARVFQFLVKMRRIAWVLSEDFEALKLAGKLSGKHSRALLKSPHYISIQIYRHVMSSMIRALDNYIVTTCILSSWKEFENDLLKARTLDDLYDCHVVYIKKVLFRCLLNNRSTPVMKLLNDMFTVILKFSRLLKMGEWQQNELEGHFTHTHFTQLQEIYHLFEKLAKYLHRVVTKLMECGYQRHLVELLTMVNLNGYYDSDKHKEDTNSSVQST